MPRNYVPIPRIELPDDWEPEGVVCALVPMPDDPQYLAMLVGLIDQLRYSALFGRDPTKTGAAIVARTWAAALKDRPILISDCEGDMPFRLRQSPVNPCILEQSLDGGATWSLAFNYSLCGGSVVVVPPYPDSDTGASDAAAQVMRNIFEGLLNILDCEAQSRDEYIALATTYMRTFDASYSNPAALGSVYDAYCALDEEEKETAKEDCTYVPHKEELQDCFASDGLIDDLNCLSDTIMDWLNDTSDALMDALNKAAAALTGSGWQAAAAGGAGGGAGFGYDCGWEQVFDFTIDEQGWEQAFGAATYVSGQGWADTYPPSPDGVRIRSIADDEFHCIGVEIFLSPALAGENPQVGARSKLYGTTVGTDIHANGNYYNIPGSVDIEGAGVFIDPKEGGLENTDAMIVKVIVHGTGFNPWA